MSCGVCADPLSQDIRLTFANAMTYNPAGHPVHVFAAKLLEDFEAQLVDVVTERIGALLAGSENVDTWLGKYPLNSDMEREVLEEQKREDLARLAGNGVGGGEDGAAVVPSSLLSSCDTRRVSFPQSLGEGSATVGAAQAGECEGWTEGQCGEEDGGMEDDKGTMHESDEGEDVLSGRDYSVRPRLRRHDSMESCVSVTELWPRRPTNSQASVCSDECGGAATERRWGFPVVETPFEKPQLGQKGVMTLMSELSRHVCRLKEDMYVITFSSGDAEPKDCQSGDLEGIIYSAVTPQSGRGQGKGKALFGSLGHAAGQESTKLRESHGTISDRCLELLRDISPDTSDPDEIRRCPFADSRQTFLELSQYRHLQFDSLRRAKHSSMMILFHLLHPHAKYIRPVCSECDGVISETRWHCNQCISGDYDVCGACMTAPWYSHPHAELTPVRVPLV